MTTYFVTFFYPRRVEEFTSEAEAVAAARAGIPAVLTNPRITQNHHVFFPIVSYTDADGYDVQVGYDPQEAQR